MPPEMIDLLTRLTEAADDALWGGIHPGISQTCLDAREEIVRLCAAIRAHRDYRGDDRCWQDDETLYATLPEGYKPPARDSAVELELCRLYIACRHNPATEYISPQREIERLRLELAEARELIREQIEGDGK